MELKINLNETEAKSAIESGALIDLIKKCTFGGPADEVAEPAPAAPVDPVTPPAVAAPEPAPLPVAKEEVAPVTLPTAAPSYSADDLSSAAVKLVEADGSKQEGLIATIQSFGVQSIPDIPAERRGEFALKLREMGAEI